MMARKLVDHLPRELRQERQVIIRVDDQRFLAIARKLVEVHHGTSGEPQLPQPLDVNLRFDSPADMPGRLSVPHHIRKISRSVVEGRHPTAWTVRGRDERVARSKAGADQTKLAVPLLLQPVE